MTVTPTPSRPPAAPAGVPAVPGTAAAAGATDPAVTGFAALVAGLLAAHVPTAAVLHGAPASAEPPSSAADEPEPAEAEDTSTQSTGASPPAGLAVVGLRVPVVTDPAHRIAVEQAPSRGSATADGPTGATPVPAAAGSAGLAGPAPGAAVEGVAGDPATPSPSPAPTAPVPGTPSPTVAAVAAPAAPIVATDLRATPPAAPQPPSATQQLLPEVTRLVSRGDGTHRLTMTLEPEALGEVRVTLTVRHGEVHVRLAAGEQAQRALLEGTPELRRVLELAGATEARVVVRDLQAPAPGGQPPTTYPAAHDGRGDTGAAGHGRSDTDDHHAGTRGGSTARDGASDGAPPPRPDPVALARTSGVDVTM